MARTTSVVAFTRKRPARKPFPEPLLRERVVVAGPTSCACCGGTRLAKLGDDLGFAQGEASPRRWRWCRARGR